jgi:prepilin-type N-terminal cleavage/methylation domain-containing protein
MRQEFTKRSWGVAASPGFSLTEMVIVLAVMLFLAAIAVPNFIRMSYDMRLNSAANNLAMLMQRARILAARNNVVYTIVIPNTGGTACIDVNADSACTSDTSGDILINFSSTITPAAAAPTGTPSAYSLSGDTANTTVNGLPYDNATTLGYSQRGLPCAYVSSTCSTPSAAYFVYYLTDSRPNGITGWAAVVVTRSGRTKAVIWNGASWN